MPDRNPGDKAVHVQKRPSTHRRCSWDGGKGKKNRFQVKCPSSCLSRPPSCSSHLQYTTTRASWFKDNYQHSNDFFGSWKLDAACGGRGNDQSQRRVVLHLAMTLASPCNLNHPVRIRAMLLSSTRERFLSC